MIIVALVHCQGVFVGNKFYVLEVAYSDKTGMKFTFHVNCPLSFPFIRKNYPYVPIPVIITKNAVPYYEVVNFLVKRYEILRKLYGNMIAFGHKGSTFQVDIFKNTIIPHVNIETLYDIPSIKQMEIEFPDVERFCNFHIRRHKYKCANYALRLVERSILYKI